MRINRLVLSSFFCAPQETWPWFGYIWMTQNHRNVIQHVSRLLLNIMVLTKRQAPLLEIGVSIMQWGYWLYIPVCPFYNSLRGKRIVHTSILHRVVALMRIRFLACNVTATVGRANQCFFTWQIFCTCALYRSSQAQAKARALSTGLNAAA